MSGFIRNLLTVLRALFSYASVAPLSRTTCSFWVSPLDTGISKLKSDKYFQLAEAAQFDYMVRTGLIGPALRLGYHFVNSAQFIRLLYPIKLFSRVKVHTQVVYADDKWVYFSHSMVVRGIQCSEVLVKMKFKKGRITIKPGALLGAHDMPKPASIDAMDVLALSGVAL